MAEKLTLKSVVITSAVAYSFRFEGYGWAIFTLNDATGELSLHSDWGTYGHRWDTNAMGQVGGRLRTVTEFLSGCDGHYVTKKLQLDTQAKELDPVVDDEESLAAIRASIITSRRNGRIGRDRARELWEDADVWSGEDFNMHCCPQELAGFLDCFWDYVHMKSSGRFEFLHKTLWPFFSAWLRENVVEKRVEVVAHA